MALIKEGSAGHCYEGTSSSMNCGYEFEFRCVCNDDENHNEIMIETDNGKTDLTKNFDQRGKKKVHAVANSGGKGG